jgi:osmotically-inducible protein OsmY
MPELEDERLRYEIEHQIGMLPGVQLAEMRVTVNQGIARIQGVVSTEAIHRSAMEAAATVSGVRGVDDALAVETDSAPEHELAEQPR